MNPLTNMKNVLKLSDQELRTSNKTSWHDQYRDSAWVFIGGLPYDLSEGDIICIFSQYGEIVNINLIRDKDSGKSKGFCFLCYEDQRSTDLAVDNFNGIKILKRIIRVDHVSNYKVPKQGKRTDEETKRLYDEGCAPKTVPIQPAAVYVKIKADPYDVRETLADQINTDIKLPQRLPIFPVKKEPLDEDVKVNEEDKKEKKHKKKRKQKKKKKKQSSDESDLDDSEDDSESKKKRKKKKKPQSSSESESEESEDDDAESKKKRKRKNKKDSSGESGVDNNEEIDKKEKDYSKEIRGKYVERPYKDRNYRKDDRYKRNRSRSRSHDRGNKRSYEAPSNYHRHRY